MIGRESLEDLASAARYSCFYSKPKALPNY